MRPAFVVALLLACVAVPRPAWTQFPPMPSDDRVRLAEAFRLADRVGERVWPGWSRAQMAVLLVGDSVEYLVEHPAPTPDFLPLGIDPVLRRAVLARRRVFAPNLLATFPAVAGVPTIVVGSAARTNRTSAAWVVTLLHEHFHQLQYALPGYQDGVMALDLTRGDTTGMWMLDYPFPYDSAPIAAAAQRFADALGDREKARVAWQALATTLAPADARYLEFQLWQEGVARWVEYAVTHAAATDGGAPAPAFDALPDHETYAALAARQQRQLVAELAPLALPERRRVAFYPLGASIALLLDRQGPEWKRRYIAEPFRLGPLLP
jgi:hypothetical protein